MENNLRFKEIEKIREIIEKAIISIISEEVIKKIDKHLKTILVVVDYQEDLKATFEIIDKLEREGFKISILLEEDSKYKALENENINILIEKNINIKKIITKYNIIVLPQLSISNTAKVANCIGDNLLTKALMIGITSKKNILVGVEGCCPYYYKENDNIGNKTLEVVPYKNKMSDNIGVLKSFGVKFTTLEKLISNLKKMISNKKAKPNGVKEIYTKKTITSKDIKILKKNSELYIDKYATVTAIGKEIANRNNITILKKL